MSNQAILIAEDDPNLGFVIEDHFSNLGYQMYLARNGADAWDVFEQRSFDLCILDVMMPHLDGFNLALKIRQKNEFIPILFLTARSMEEDKLKGFEIGGDDYITKPFSIDELTYRVKVFLRRKIDIKETAELLTLGSYQFDTKNLLVMRDGMTIQLTQMEADLLKLLFQNINNLVKREDILVKIWGENDYFKGRSLDVFISRLRKYLKEDPELEIRNHHGVGFILLDQYFSG